MVLLPHTAVACIRQIIPDYPESAVSTTWTRDEVAYVKPRCEETNFSRARPISGRTVEWVFRHSSSRSYTQMHKYRGRQQGGTRGDLWGRVFG